MHLGTVGSASQAKKKLRSRGRGRAAHGLPSHPAPPPASPSQAQPAPREEDVRFPAQDICLKQGVNLQRLDAADLRNHLGRLQSSSQGEDKPASSKGKSSGHSSRDRGDRESRGSQSSSSSGGSSHHHKGSSAKPAPPKAPPASTVSSGSLGKTSYAQVAAKGAMGPPKDQGKRTADQRDRSRDSQVQHSSVSEEQDCSCLVFSFMRKYEDTFC